MARLHVVPRPTPEERAEADLQIDVDEDLTVLANTIEDWTAPRQSWEFTLIEGHDFGRPNNVEGRLMFAQGEQSSSARFRLDQLSSVDDFQDTLVLRFEENEGICKAISCTSNGLDVELHHIILH
jgi:hypothetical protein